MRMFLALSLLALVALSIGVWRLQPPADPQGRVVLTWVSDENPLREQQARLFERLHPGIKIQVDPANSGVEKVIVQSLAGVGPDVFDAFSSFQLAAYVHSEVALDLTEEVRNWGIDLNKQVFPGVLGTCILDGRVYGLPTNVAVDGLFYNEEMLQEAGLPPPKAPWKWADMITLAQRLVQRAPDGSIERYGFLFDWWDWRQFFDTFGARIFSPDGVHCILNRPPAIHAVQLMQDLIYKYKVSPSPSEESSMATQGGFGSGTITFFGSKRGAMALGGRWWLSELRGFKGLNLGVVESPYGTTREYHTQGRSLLVNRNSKHLQEALEFERFMASDAYLDLVNAQADGLGAFKRADNKPSFLFNREYPSERFNRVWRDIAGLGVKDDTSPFVDANSAEKLIQDQLDLVQGNQKSPEQAMRDAAANIEAAMKKAIAEDPSLAERYRAATRR